MAVHVMRRDREMREIVIWLILTYIAFEAVGYFGHSQAK